MGGWVVESAGEVLETCCVDFHERLFLGFVSWVGMLSALDKGTIHHSSAVAIGGVQNAQQNILFPQNKERVLLPRNYLKNQ